MSWTVVDEDVMAVIREMEPGRRYPARELYRRYQEVARSAGRGPAHPVGFGHKLRQAGLMRRKARINGKMTHCWLL